MRRHLALLLLPVIAAWLPVASAAAQRSAPALRLVPGARVRAAGVDARLHVGRILPRDGDSLYVQLERGDTLILPPGASLELSLGRTGTAKWAGAVTGWAATWLVIAVLTQFQATAEEWGPVPLVGAVAGGWIGSRIRRERWVPMQVHGVRDAP